MELRLNNIISLVDVIHIVDYYTGKFYDKCREEYTSKYLKSSFKYNLRTVRDSVKYKDFDDWFDVITKEISNNTIVKMLRKYNIINTDSLEELRDYNCGLNYLVVKNVLRILSPLDFMKCYLKISGNYIDYEKIIDEFLQDVSNKAIMDNMIDNDEIDIELLNYDCYSAIVIQDLQTFKTELESVELMNYYMYYTVKNKTNKNSTYNDDPTSSIDLDILNLPVLFAGNFNWQGEKEMYILITPSVSHVYNGLEGVIGEYISDDFYNNQKTGESMYKNYGLTVSDDTIFLQFSDSNITLSQKYKSTVCNNVSGRREYINRVNLVSLTNICSIGVNIDDLPEEFRILPCSISDYNDSKYEEDFGVHAVCFD